MASLRKRRGTGMEESDGQVMVNVMKKISHFIRNQKSTAVERLMEIRKVKSYIREGMEFSFPWLSKCCLKLKVIRLTIKKLLKWNHKRKGI